MTVQDLQPYQEGVAARRAKNPGNPTWTMLRARWEAVTAHAGGLLEAQRNTGAAGASHERQTAELLQILRDNASADEVINVVLAMFGFSEHRPTRFKSDKAFGFQLARRVRGLARVNAGSHLDAKTGRLKRTYRDTPPKAMECLAETLQLAFGVAGMRLAAMDKQDAEVVMVERQQLHDALKDMT